MIKMTIMLAGVPLECRFQHRENQIFLADYQTDRPPEFTVEPAAEDLKSAAESLRRTGKLPEEAEIPGWFAENTALHLLIAKNLVGYDALLVHGSAVVADGAAYLFMASSGTGKSTHTRLWRQYLGDRAWMLNDDKPLLRVQEGEVMAYGTPWDGKHHLSRNAAAPLKGIARIVRSNENHIEPLPAAAAFPLLYRHALRADDREQMEKILSLEEKIVGKVPVYSLHCNMEQDAAELAYCTMKNGWQK